MSGEAIYAWQKPGWPNATVNKSLLTRLSTFALCFDFFHADNFKSPAAGVEFGRLLLQKAV